MAAAPPDIDNPIPVSALASYSYCPRQCALNHLEQAYDDNIFTLKGKAVHERVDRNPPLPFPAFARNTACRCGPRGSG